MSLCNFYVQLSPSLKFFGRQMFFQQLFKVLEHVGLANFFGVNISVEQDGESDT